MTNVINSNFINTQASFRADDKISLEKLEYSYIEKCNDVKELVSVYNSLRAGVFGFYPNLCQTCELKIRKLDPHNAALVTQPRRIRKVMPNDDATKDFNEWLNEYNPNIDSMKDKDQGDIRSQATININGDEKDEDLKDEEGNFINTPKNDNKRISGYDFRSWDLYDVDKACAEIDSDKTESDKSAGKIEKQVSSSTSSEEYTEIQPPSPKSEPEPIKSPEQLEKEKQEQLEKERKNIELSEKFKEKGNQYYKEKKFKESKIAYTKAIDFNISNLLAYNNRALVNLKLECYQETIQDCTDVLNNEFHNIKALLRRAQAFKFLGLWDKAEKDIHKVKTIDKDEGRKSSKDVEILAKEIEFNLSKLKNDNFKRMTIESDSESEDEPPKLTVKNEKLAPLIRKSTSNTSQSEKSKIEEIHVESKSPPPVYSTVMSLKNDIPIPDKLNDLKQQADKYYKLGQYSTANQSYQNCLSYVKSNKLHKSLKLLTVNLHNNLAICFIKMGQYSSAINEATVIIEDLDPYNEKAFLRRALCYEHKDAWIPAWYDYRQVLNKNIANSNARIGIDRVTELLKDKYGSEWRSKVEVYSKRAAEKKRQRAIDRKFEVEKEEAKVSLKEVVEDDIEENEKLAATNVVNEPTFKEGSSQDKLEKTLKEAEIQFTEVRKVLDEMKNERSDIVSNVKVDVESAVKEARNSECNIKPSKVSLPPPDISDSEDDEPYPDSKLYDCNLNSVTFYSNFRASNGDKKIVRDNWLMLSKIDPEELTNIIGNSLEGDILFEIVKIVRKFVMPQKPKVALKYFESLTVCNRFEMCLAYLEEQEEEKIYTVLKCLKQMLTTLEEGDKIQNLFCKFGFVQN